MYKQHIHGSTQIVDTALTGCVAVFCLAVIVARAADMA